MLVSTPVAEIVNWGMAFMITTFQALLVFLLFLPGFVSQRVVEKLTPRRPRNNFERFIDAVGLSLVIYVIYIVIAPVFGLSKIPIELSTVASKSTPYILEHMNDLILTGEAALLLGLAVFTGMLLGKGLEQGWIYYILRAEYIPDADPTSNKPLARLQRNLKSILQMTRGTGRSTVWEDVLSEPMAHILRVHLTDGREILGQCKYYSDDPNRDEILIKPPYESLIQDPHGRQNKVWIKDPAGRWQSIPGKGVFLTSQAEVKMVELLGRP